MAPKNATPVPTSRRPALPVIFPMFIRPIALPVDMGITIPSDMVIIPDPMDPDMAAPDVLAGASFHAIVTSALDGVGIGTIDMDMDMDDMDDMDMDIEVVAAEEEVDDAVDSARARGAKSAIAATVKLEASIFEIFRFLDIFFR
ncbi:hypothetical protein COCCADRAFT_6388 [Bipolaris zeicola 26-R-13]|uniref:Uncharacterized protein n=1 Tax=Cochliobolus carbonum (strain 26-R-13) TaxID=930089 RepID=W6YKE4_COCC2|nr:uncharacterized protein COCCADRAFT_6388 [Bipolaris zeicola 26-R-13]EUC31766.1 hypothetical protein COCCADRAFT_6388 [Bipolaris zeicola 26-R-13]